MKTFAVSMVKNEIDVITDTVLHTLGQVDHMIVSDNLSTDGTREELDRLSKMHSNLTVINDPDPAYHQSEKTTALANMAANMGATYILVVDADEYWASLSGQKIKHVLDQVGGTLFPAQMFDFVPTAMDDDGKDIFHKIQWRRREPGPMEKVAFKWSKGTVVEMGAHSISRKNVSWEQVREHVLYCRHYPYRSADQFVNKAVQGGRALELTDLPEDRGAHWRQYYDTYKTGGHSSLAQIFYQWFYEDSPDESDLVFDPL